MNGCAAHIAAVKHHCIIEQPLATFFLAGESFEQLVKHAHLLPAGLFELLHFLHGLPVMAEAMVIIRGVAIAVQLKGGGQKSIHHQGYDAGGVGLESHLRH